MIEIPPQPTAESPTVVPTDPARPAVAPAAAPATGDITAAVRAVDRSAKVSALVVDRTTGAEIVSLDPDRQFRSASVVKLLIAIATLSDGADALTRKQIARMLSLSDDDIASALWVREGGAALVTKTARKLGLRATKPPAIIGRWGDVILTAHDVATVYQYILHDLPADDRSLIVDALAAAPRSAADGFDQYFGIPSAGVEPWAIKQGWSNSTNDIVLHSTGLVGRDWRYIVIVLTSHPLSVRFGTGARSVTAGMKVLAPLLR
ncbi:hypothetical protein [Actinokineospora enzanensis]|uniref:hypothetical protein n=1 Tax=Actinokineospora enzanensis TaxID=155975 RepID=UPI0012EB8417|nr:hypothetical protein [Actinokineospora enzanensis]